jgi:DNA-binding NarL/FixJ family response regulator
MSERTFLVVDDNVAFSRSLCRLVSRYGKTMCVATVRDALSALDCRADWSAAIVDLFLTDGSELDVLMKFRSTQATARAMILTGYADPGAINAAHDLKADYVVKPLDPARMHRFLLSSVIAHHGLSEREQNVLQRLSHGQKSKTIASDLGLADSTVRVMLRRISDKLGTRCRAELLERAATIVQSSKGDSPRRNS